VGFIPTFVPTTPRDGPVPVGPVERSVLLSGPRRHALTRAERGSGTYDIFEGTEQIQQLVIARAISGLRIE
jgi:hypothetical protein